MTSETKRIIGMLLVIALAGVAKQMWDVRVRAEARAVAAERLRRELEKPIRTMPWVTCVGEGQTNCVVRELPVPDYQ